MNPPLRDKLQILFADNEPERIEVKHPLRKLVGGWLALLGVLVMFLYWIL
jgi:hypothetical protein